MTPAQPIQRSEAVKTEALFRSHAPFVARMLGRLGVMSDELDDAVQEVFLVVHRNGGYAPGPATPVGYLASVVVRVAASRRRRVKKTRERTSTVAPDDMCSPAHDPARRCEVREELAVVQDALDRLTPDLRTTLVLAELEGESCKDIAAMMRIPVGTVYWRLHRARKTFRLALGTAEVPTERSSDGGESAEHMLSEAAANDTLRRARAHPLAVYDVVSGLERLRRGLPLLTKAPLWMAGLTRTAGVMGRVGIVNPAVLSVVASVSLFPGTPVGASPAAPAGPGLSARTMASLVAGPSLARPVAPPMTEVAAPFEEPAVVRAPAPMETPAVAAPQRTLAIAAPATLSVAAVAPPPRTTESAPTAPARPSTEETVPSGGDGDLHEIQGVATAERLLAGDPARALALVRQDQAQFAAGYLSEERHYIAALALFALGRTDEAQAEAARFLRDYPDGPFTARVRAASERQRSVGRRPSVGAASREQASSTKDFR